MNQYTPVRKCKFAELNKRVDDSVYDEVIEYAWNIGIRKAFIQDGGTQSDSFIPEWDFKL
jgi:putative pyruvate formate lyase activating enzyme